VRRRASFLPGGTLLFSSERYPVAILVCDMPERNSFFRWGRSPHTICRRGKSRRSVGFQYTQQNGPGKPGPKGRDDNSQRNQLR
jgi:hypothetical protein